MQGHKNIQMPEVNPQLICILCGGYLVDATTIVECLHSFCKTCIVRYLESSKFCPVCDVMVHKKRPLQRIRPDPILQDLVYKIVPGLFKEEMRRRREFYDKNKTEEGKFKDEETEGPRVIFSPDEKISLSLELCPYGVHVDDDCDELDDNSKLRDCRNLLCPATVTIAHLKKFIRMKFSLSSRYQIDVFHGRESLRDGYTLIDIAYISSWKRKGQLSLCYSIFENPSKRMKLEIPVPLKTHAKILASTPKTNVGPTFTQCFRGPPPSATIRPDHCTTQTTACSVSTSAIQTMIPEHCLNAIRTDPRETARSSQHAASTASRSRAGHCDITVPQTPRPAQCTFLAQVPRVGQGTTTTVSTSKHDLCTTSVSSTLQPVVTSCQSGSPICMDKNLCSAISTTHVLKVNDNVLQNNTGSVSASTNTDPVESIPEVDKNDKHDTCHSRKTETFLETEDETNKQKKDGPSSANTECLETAIGCAETHTGATDTADEPPSIIEPNEHTVNHNGDISEAETEDYDTVYNNKPGKDTMKEVDFSNVDENRNQKLQNDVHTQTDADGLQETNVVLSSQTILKETKVTETAQTQTSFSTESQLSQTINLLREKIALSEQTSYCVDNNYKQANSAETTTKSSEKSDDGKVVVEEIPSANIQIAGESRVKFLDRSECHYSATVNGFYRDPDEKLTATVKQEVTSDCATETS